MDASGKEVVVIAAIAKCVLENKPRKNCKRKLWVKPWLQRMS